MFRVFFGLILVVFLPGFSLTALLFPKRDDLDGIERLALSFILSLAVTPSLGLMLNFTPFGIRLLPVLIILSAFTGSVALFAWDRRSKLPDEERFKTPFKNPKFNLGQSKQDKILNMILIGVIIGSFATLTYVVMTPRIGERFTEFYILDPNGTTSNYPTELKVEDEEKVIVCIVNHEDENVTYRLEVNLNGSLIHEEYIFLNENEKWSGSVIFKASKIGEKQKLELIIYMEQQIVAYRKLSLWVNVT